MRIECAHDEVLPIDKIIPNDLNANQHPEDQIDLLAKIMEKHGVRNPIIISNRSGKVICGHGRRLAAIKNGWTSFPVDFQNFATEAEEVQAMIADNTIQEFSETDRDMVKELMISIPGMDIEMLAMPDLNLVDITVEEKPDNMPVDKVHDCPACKCK